MSSKPHGGRRAKKHEEEEHENHERWLVSYADMMTLLLVLFVVLFAMSQVDKAKFAALASGLAETFGAPVSVAASTTPEGSVLDDLPGVIDIASAIPPEPTVQQAEVDAAAAQAALERAERVAAEAQAAYDDLSEARARIDAALEAAGFPDAARYEIDERGLVVHIVADAVLFDAESAFLRPEGARILDAVAPTLGQLPNVLRVEGHANHLAVTPGGPWPSNWELSAYRATTVLRHLTGRGVPEPRISAAGYSSTQPLVPVTDPTSISTNRRVDVVVLSPASAEANALLPGLDAGANPEDPS
ncbi:flagellar motor protein MotB [Geodermatophilus sp. YIM 151500]|uniref:OmpA/MotB family protein n=1 Tax=Geodermatophilus sp. YIM 151500 TaxID=2984531 RepID=UPI0021E4B639|nr:flagellar motor protein MotB [Geodermatophilus sp. YIM 151500]MCV2489502.1 flagellar motor protein MotB [Geodermatophilus sp. YIM 151500]